MNYLDYLLNSKNNPDQQPGDIYAAANTAAGPFSSPDDTGGGMVDNTPAPQKAPVGPASLSELASNGVPAQGMGDSLMQRSGDDIPKPQDNIDDLNDLNVSGPANPPSFDDDAQVPQAPPLAPQPQGDADLIDAQNRSNNLAGLMMLGKGAQRIGAGFARVAPDKDYLNEMQPLINRPVEDVLAQRQAAGQKLDQEIKKFNFDFAKDKNDPDSDSSTFYRDTMNTLSKQAGINLNIPPTMTAAEMEKLYPNIINIVNSKEARDARIIAAQGMYAQKQEKVNDTLTANLKKDLDPNQARAGNMAKSQAMLNTLDRADALFQQFPDGNIPAVQTNELSGVIAGVVNGGSAQSQHQINSLTPSSMTGDASKIAGWITNNPTGLHQQQFIKQLQDTSGRERGVAQSQIMLAKIQRIPAYNKLAQNNPDQFAAELQGAGLNPADFDQRGQYVGNNPTILQGMKNMRGENMGTAASTQAGNAPVQQAGGLTPAQNAGVAAFMKANKITNKEQAIAILKQNGRL